MADLFVSAGCCVCRDVWGLDRIPFYQCSFFSSTPAPLQSSLQVSQGCTVHCDTHLPLCKALDPKEDSTRPCHLVFAGACCLRSEKSCLGCSSLCLLVLLLSRNFLVLLGGRVKQHIVALQKLFVYFPHLQRTVSITLFPFHLPQGYNCTATSNFVCAASTRCSAFKLIAALHLLSIDRSGAFDPKGVHLLQSIPEGSLRIWWRGCALYLSCSGCLRGNVPQQRLKRGSTLRKGR